MKHSKWLRSSRRMKEEAELPQEYHQCCICHCLLFLVVVGGCGWLVGNLSNLSNISHLQCRVEYLTVVVDCLISVVFLFGSRAAKSTTVRNNSQQNLLNYYLSLLLYLTLHTQCEQGTAETMTKAGATPNLVQRGCNPLLKLCFTLPKNRKKTKKREKSLKCTLQNDWQNINADDHRASLQILLH